MTNFKVINFISVYMPSIGCTDDFSASVDELSEIVESREEDSITIICGDFNGDIGYRKGPKFYKRPNKQGTLVANFFRRHGLFPVNLQDFTVGASHTFEGCNGKSFIDYIAMPEVIMDSVTSCRVGEWHELNNSDHLPVFATINIGKISLAPCEYNS